jgi:hypothetical protein
VPDDPPLEPLEPLEPELPDPDDPDDPEPDVPRPTACPWARTGDANAAEMRREIASWAGLDITSSSKGRTTL